MPLPKQVQAAGARADAIIEAHRQAQEQAAANANGADGDPATGLQPQQAGNQPAQPQPQPSAPAAGLDTSNNPQPPAGDQADQKYRTLLGKYNAEVPRLHQQVRQIQAQVDALAAENEQLKADAAKAPVQPAPKPIDFDALGSEFPEELVDPLRSMYSQLETVSQVNEQLRAQLAQVQGNVGQMAEDTQQERQRKFLIRLAELVPDYEAINQRDDWRMWLAGFREPDGRQWQQLLDHAARMGDAEGVAEIFNAFGQARQAPPPRTPQPPTVPDNVNTSPQPAQAQTWTRAAVKQFYDDWASGMLKRRGWMPDRIAQVDAEITAAQAEGRISG